MGQRAGRPKSSRTFKLEGYQTMTAEADEENGTEDALEKRKKMLQAICGMADLRNGAVGLYNIGLSCCLNSLLQVFFMNRHFTMILRRIKVPFDPTEQKASIPYQMLLLLEQMQQSKRKSVHPVDLARCLSIHNVKFLVLYDASHLFLILWNLIKDQITNVDLAERLTVLYTIRLQEHLVCQKCSTETKNASNMLMLPLPLFDSDFRLVRTLEDSLCCFFAPEQLTDENACHCEECEMKMPCLRSMKVMHLPQTLMLHLKRFCCKEGSHTRKIRHSLAFPQSLDFSQILTSEQYYPDAQEEVSWDDVKCTYGRASLRWGETAYILVYMKKNGGKL
ncbi:ubl carboxyl-terminal hydrolase 18 isoform X2 [Rhineura floridana]|uniref:ubl carboxyl-terminal hydrolase 18 isoform X2 n=1 Tax=Rhineura floridana TaxID=261503 RepID=UPI002AC82DEB|nr:ubl carboxyl-terminal hydrolase 18 isoform X2 [Rhineura floridana]